MIEHCENGAKRLYTYGEKKAIVDYILIDWSERIRLRVYTIPKATLHYIIRGPIPWHNNYHVSKEILRNNLFIAHPVIIAIMKLWNDV